jgi:hypothetical protein
MSRTGKYLEGNQRAGNESRNSLMCQLLPKFMCIEKY